jgi:hypothetical protein
MFGYADIIFVSGGYSEQLQTNVDWLQKFNTSQDVWKIIGNMNNPRYGLTGGIYQDSAYVSGGVHEDSQESKSLEKWNYQTSILTQIIDTSSYFDRIFAAGVLLNNKYYIFGGNPYIIGDSTDLPYIVEYDISTKTVIYTDNTTFYGEILPEQQMVSAIGNDIFIFGGVRIGISSKIYKFDTITKTFEELSIEMSEPRAAGAAVFFNQTGEIYIIGGYNENSPALNSVDIFRFDGQNYVIEPGPEIKIPRSQLMAINSESNLYVMGGFNINGEVISDIEKLVSSTTSVEDTDIMPHRIELYQNYPNPFNPATTISFYLPTNSYTELTVIDVNGEIVANLIARELAAGKHNVEFNGALLSSGIYFYTLKAGNSIISQKMLLLK